MNEIERYVRRASRGLWGKKRREVAAELRGHIESRVVEFRASGLGQAEAIRQTLRELGAPEQVRAGMGQVYLLPMMVRSGALALIGAVLATSLVTRGIAQVRAFYATSTNPYLEAYLDRADLRSELESADVDVTGIDKLPVMLVAELGQKLQITTSPGRRTSDAAADLLKRDDVLKYVSLRDVLQLLEGTSLPVTVKGWTNPTLSVGKTHIDLGSAGQPFNVYPLYAQQVKKFFDGVAGKTWWTSTRWRSDFEYQTAPLKGGGDHRIAVNAPAGSVFAVVTVEHNLSENADSPIQSSYSFDIAPVSADGTLSFLLPRRAEYVQFTDNVALLRQDMRELDTLKHGPYVGEKGNPVHAVLLRLSDDLYNTAAPAYQIVPPCPEAT